jgi:hypothetical protein
MRTIAIAGVASGVLALLWFCVVAGDPPLAEAQDATTCQSLERLLTEHPERALEIIPRLEAQALKEVKAQRGPGRFRIKEIAPLADYRSGQVTLTGIGDSGDAEVSGDLEIGLKADGSGGSINIPWGKDSIHRFVGKVEIKGTGYTFIGEGDESHRLTFALVDGVGYVYLRGKGKVIGKEGKEIKLGYSRK